MQFLVKAYDYKDALDKRMAVRPQHIENLQKVKEYGSVVCAGGLFDDDDQFIGSYLVMNFETKELLNKYLESEPYIKEKVWEKVEVENCKVVIMNDEKMA